MLINKKILKGVVVMKFLVNPKVSGKLTTNCGVQTGKIAVVCGRQIGKVSKCGLQVGRA